MNNFHDRQKEEVFFNDKKGVSLRAGLSPLAFPLKKREELKQWLNP
jgi:hypothetical protein